MVDWTTHLGLGWLVSKTKKVEKIPFLIGCVLPDLVRWLGYPFQLFIVPFYSKLIDAFLKPSHTIVGVFLLSFIASALFVNSSSRTILSLFSGGGFHLFLDTLQKARVGYGIYLFWPLSWNAYAVDLVSVFDPMPSAVTSILCLVIFAYGRRRSKRAHRSTKQSFLLEPFKVK